MSWDRLSNTHPLVITLVYILTFVTAGDVVARTLHTGYPALISAFIQLASFLIIILWYYAVYRTSIDKLAERVRSRGGRGWFFLTTGAAAVLFSLANGGIASDAFPTGQLLVLVILAVAFIVSIWSTARGLVAAEKSTETPELAGTIGTFLLLFYLPIGIWFLYKRIKAVTHRVRGHEAA